MKDLQLNGFFLHQDIFSLGFEIFVSMVGKVPMMVSMYISPTEMLVNKPAVFFCLKMWSVERSHREEIVGL